MDSSESVDALIRPTILSSEVTGRHLSKIAFVHCAANVGLWRRLYGVWGSLECLALTFDLIRHRAGTALGNGWRIQRVGCCTED